MGRSSTIQDYDVTIPDPQSDCPSQSPITSFFSLWVAASRLQGQIYELLYCPDAIAQPDSVRKSRAQLLIHRLEDLESRTQEETVSDLTPETFLPTTTSNCDN